jgi:RecJ-like exonuclease
VCSASLAFSVKKGARIFFTSPAGLLPDLKQFNEENLIITDIALTSSHKEEIISEFKRISSKGEVTYFDHHPLPPGLSAEDIPATLVRNNDESCASELVYNYFKSELDPELSRVMIYGAIGDYSDNTQVVKEVLKGWDKRELYLEAGILIKVLEGTRKRDYEFKRNIVFYLSQNKLPSLNEEFVKIAVQESKIDEQMRLIVKEKSKVLGNVAYVEDIPWSLGKAATYARAYNRTLVGVAAELRKEYVDMSIRSINLENLHEVVSRVAGSFNGTGGGHKNAAGARIPKECFIQFINKLNETISIQLSS